MLAGKIQYRITAQGDACLYNWENNAQPHVRLPRLDVADDISKIASLVRFRAFQGVPSNLWRYHPKWRRCMTSSSVSALEAIDKFSAFLGVHWLQYSSNMSLVCSIRLMVVLRRMGRVSA